MAASLPTELTQLILHHLDPESYLSAHQTCRSWRHASSSPYMLHHTLHQIPASHVPPPDILTPAQWTAYFAQTARFNLLGRRHRVCKSVAPRLAPEGAETGSMVVGASEDGKTVVGLRGAQVLVWRAQSAEMIFAPGSDFSASESADSDSDSDTEPQPHPEPNPKPHAEAESRPEGQPSLTPPPSSSFSLASSLYPHWTSVCRALMDRSNAGYFGVTTRHSKHRLAVSSRGEFVAVALGRVIQIYGLRSARQPGAEPAALNSPGILDEDLTVPAEHVLGQVRSTVHGVFSRAPDQTQTQTPHLAYEDTDGVVEGLEFVERDTLLRVAIGKESTIHRPTRVRYLGCPDAAAATGGLDLRYWRQAIGVVYLDSAALGVALSSTAAAAGAGVGTGRETRCQLRGLRLLERDCGYQSSSSSSSSSSTQSRFTTEPTSTAERYFIASLQTGDIDTYCIGLAKSHSASASGSSSSPGSISVKITHLLPTIYSLPGNILPTTPQSKEYPCLYPYPHSDPTQSPAQTASQTSPSTHDIPTATATATTTTTKAVHSYNYNLQTTLPRFTSANLPSGTFSAPLLAVSSDGLILAIYEPDHACCVAEGGALYICYVGGWQSEPGSGCGVPGGEGKYPSEIPRWPFLLDRVSVDVERIAVRRATGGKYVVTGVAGEEVMEWVF